MQPAKVIGWNDMPFDRDTGVAPSNIVLDRGFGHPCKDEVITLFLDLQKPKNQPKNAL